MRTEFSPTAAPRLLARALAVVALLVAGVLPGVASAGSSEEPAMRVDKKLKVDSVCFTVTNPSLGKSTLYGQRYVGGQTAANAPAIVLVHGIASSTANWDFTPTWSVARGLAAKGYVVFSYDRLGYAKSSWFEQPGGGFMITTSAHRDMLHDVVGAVKSGGYATTAGGDCSSPQQPSTMQNRTVVIAGHSAGGWIVAGYPGKYHDVAAMIQTAIKGSAGPSNPANDHGDDPGPSQGGHFDPNPEHPDYFDFFHERADCEAFNTFPPAILRSVVDVACAPPFIPSPYGEIAGIGEMYAENDLYISRIGPSIPVLLTSGDHDTTAPPPTPATTSTTTGPTAAATCPSGSSRTPRTCSWFTARCRPGSTTSRAG